MEFVMSKLHAVWVLCGVIAALPITVSAAPLDALLSADEYHHAGELRAEASYDAMNNTLDVFKIRASDPVYAGTNVGDYSGLHLRLGYALTDRFSLDGGVWQRKITYRTDNESLDSWQLAGQYNLLGNDSSTSHLALRLGAWGDQASLLNKSSATTLAGRVLNSVTINSPKDIQNQIDVIGTLRLTRQASVSSFIGAGHSTVSTGDMAATYTSSNGCNYNLAFTGSGTSGVLSAPCSASGAVINSFGSSQSVVQDFSYKASYYQFGGMWQWHNRNWALRGGYQYQYWRRSNVDNLIISGGGVAYKSNQIIVVDVMRKVVDHVAVFVRGQEMSNQFVGEIPFAYNGVTASKFARRYGFASVGVVMEF